jgi:hypothetical protein
MPVELILASQGDLFGLPISSARVLRFHFEFEDTGMSMKEIPSVQHVWSVDGVEAFQRFTSRLDRAIAQCIASTSSLQTILDLAVECDSPDLRVGKRRLRPYMDISIAVVVGSKLAQFKASELSITPTDLVAQLGKENPRSRTALVIMGRDRLILRDYMGAISAAKSAIALESSCPTAQDLLFDAYVARDGAGKANADINTSDLSSRFCSLPFDYIELLTLPDVGARKFGTHAFACACAGWQPFPIGDLATAPDWKSIWHGEEAKEVRRSIIDGDYSYCSRSLCPYIVADTLPLKTDVTDHRHKAFISSRGSDSVGAPKTAQISHDNSCNLACPSCRTEVVVAKSATRSRYDDMAERIINPMMREMAGVASITGMGDPFGSKHYRSIIRRLTRNEFPTLDLDIITNALLLTKGEWDSLGPAQEMIKNIRVSIDAATASTYEIVRRPGKWSILRENLDLILSLRASGKIQYFQICFVVQAVNFTEMPAFVRLGQSLAVDNILFQKLWNFGSFSSEIFLQNDVLDPSHPRHGELLTVLRDPVFDDPRVDLFNVSTEAEEAA